MIENVWFTDQNSKLLEIEEVIDIILVINSSIKMTRYPVQTRHTTWIFIFC